MEQLERLINFCELHGVGDVLIELQLALHVSVAKLWDLWLRLPATKGRAFPRAPGNQLEWPSGDFLASCCNANDYGSAPTTMRALEGGPHHLNISSTVKRVVHAEASHAHDMLLDGDLDLGRVDNVGGTPLLGELELLVDNIDSDDARGAGEDQSFDDGEANGANAKDRSRGALLDLGGIPHGAPASGHAATEEADLFEWRLLRNLCERD
mmetsp:Transcript_26974/g.75796  ORF Transcript_26974/g.75796 Transcript_26974/m.75796 type:complete len:210 (+) Transcript_26974:381-1010(+)